MNVAIKFLLLIALSTQFFAALAGLHLPSGSSAKDLIHASLPASETGGESEVDTADSPLHSESGPDIATCHVSCTLSAVDDLPAQSADVAGSSPRGPPA